MVRLGLRLYEFNIKTGNTIGMCSIIHNSNKILILYFESIDGFSRLLILLNKSFIWRVKKVNKNRNKYSLLNS